MRKQATNQPQIKPEFGEIVPLERQAAVSKIKRQLGRPCVGPSKIIYHPSASLRADSDTEDAEFLISIKFSP